MAELTDIRETVRDPLRRRRQSRSRRASTSRLLQPGSRQP